MANLNIQKGDSVTLQGVFATKINVNGNHLCHGYGISKSPSFVITVDDYMSSAFLMENGELYKVYPEFDDDFYIILAINGESL